MRQTSLAAKTAVLLISSMLVRTSLPANSNGPRGPVAAISAGRGRPAPEGSGTDKVLRINVLDPAFGCRGDGHSNDYGCLHRAIEYLESHGGGTLYLPGTQNESPAFRGDYVCGSVAGAGNRNGCIEVSKSGNIRVEFAPGARLVMKNLSTNGLDGSYHGIFVGDPSFSHLISNVTLIGPRIVWDPAPRRRTQGDGIHILGAPVLARATRDVQVLGGAVENAPQVAFGAFGTVNVELKTFKTTNSFGNGTIFSSTWSGSRAEDITCKWTSAIGDDCVEVTAYYNLSNPLATFVFNNGEEPFNSPDHSLRNNNGAVIRNVHAEGGLADGLRLAGCFRCSADGITVSGKSAAGVILDSSVKGSTYLASTESTVRNVIASGNAENFLIFANGDVKPRGQIQAIGIADGGAGYGRQATCKIVDPKGGACEISVIDGQVKAVSFTSAAGYPSAPKVEVDDAFGKGARLIATLSDDFLNFRGDFATNLKLGDGKMDNLLATGNVYGFSLGVIDATSSQVRLNASDFTIDRLDCTCNGARGIYISGGSQAFPSPIDQTTPFHNIRLGSIVNRAGPVEIRDARSVTADLLESDNSTGRGILLERLLDTKITTIKVRLPNRRNGSDNEAVLIDTAHRLTISTAYINSDSYPTVPLSIGGGSAEDKSQQIEITNILLRKGDAHGNENIKLQTGAFAPESLKLIYRVCEPGVQKPVWKTATHSATPENLASESCAELDAANSQ